MATGLHPQGEWVTLGLHCETNHSVFFFECSLIGVASFRGRTSFGGAYPKIFFFGGHLFVALGTGGQPGGCPGSGDKPAWGLGA